MSRVVCPYCQGIAQFCLSSAFVYHGRDYGPIYYCACEPAWVGCHKGSEKPLGRLANKGLRKAKMAAHRAFDPLWKGGMRTRRAAYAWLAGRLGLPVGKTHIGMFDEEQCAEVVRACQEEAQEGREHHA